VGHGDVMQLYMQAMTAQCGKMCQLDTEQHMLKAAWC